MTSLADLYVHYCRRTEVKPNSGFLKKLNEASRLNGGKRDITAVDLSQNYVGTSGLVPITDLIRNTPSIQSVNLSNCFLEHEQLETVLTGFSLHPSLTTLVLRSNSLHDSSLHAILDFLKQNPLIISFDVSGNDFLPSSVSAIDEQLNINRMHTRTLETVPTSTQVRSNTAIPSAASVSTITAADGSRIADEGEATHVVAVRSHHCEITGRVTPELSGGHMHFASWRTNRQFALRLGRATDVDDSSRTDGSGKSERRLSEVRVELNVTDGVVDSRLVGFVVLKGNGMSRIINPMPDVQKLIVGESALHCSYCVADVRVDCDEVYHIMPFSMQPGKGFSFILSVEAIASARNVHNGVIDRPFVALAPLDSRYDWLEAAQADEWADPSDNGGGLQHSETWRRSIAYRIALGDNQTDRGDDHSVQMDNPSSGNVSVADEQLHVVIEMITSVDPDACGNRSIGFQIVLEDPSNPGRPPLCPSAADILWNEPHTRTNSVVVECTFRRGDLNRCFLFPNTETPGQCGPYSIRVYSTIPVSVERSVYPHGWWSKTLCGEWTDQMCGGPPLGPSKSWRYNPSFEIESPQGGCALRAFLRMTSRGPVVNAIDAPDGDHDEADLSEAEKQKMEMALYLESHQTANGGGGALLLTNASTLANEYAPPLDTYTTSEFVLEENHFSDGRRVLLVPHTRFPGYIGAFSVEILSGEPLLLDTEPLSVAERYRVKCIDEHQKTTQLRHAALDEERALVNQRSDNGAARNYLQHNGHDEEQDASEDLATRPETTWDTPQLKDAMNTDVAREQYEEVVRACRLSRQPHVDREFPRGCSSLCLDPNSCAPTGFPNVCSWKRPRDIVFPDSNGGLSAPHQRDGAAAREVLYIPSSPDEEMWRMHPVHQWLQSAVNAVACKPRWVGEVSLGYDQELGVAQFRFFKRGQWIPVTVDDFLPVDEHGDLCFGEVRIAGPPEGSATQEIPSETTHDASGWVDNAVRRESINFFYPLLAKAYAKLHRCYQALDISLSSDVQWVDDTVLIRTLQEGLADLTGCVTSVKSLQSNESDSLAVNRTTNSNTNTRKSRELDAWNRLKLSSSPHCIVSLLLTNSSRNAAQLKRQGLSTDILYAVIGTHRVAGYDLVHMKDWRQPYEETKWNGRFGRKSTLWTPELHALLRPDLEPASLWMTIGEVMASFTDILVSTKAESAVSWVPLNDAGEVAGSDDSALWWENGPQFSLSVSHLSPPGEASADASLAVNGDGSSNNNNNAQEPLTVTVGLHQPDLRMGLTRSADARVHYIAGMQLAVLLSENNRRRVSKSDNDSPIDVYEGPMEYRRDVYVTFPVPLANPSTSCTELSIASLVTNAAKLRGSCVLSIRCSSRAVNVSLTPIASATNRTVVTGRWKTHGGLSDSLPTSVSWRDNPQYCLLPSAAGDCSITLRLANHPAFEGKVHEPVGVMVPLTSSNGTRHANPHIPSSYAEIFPDGLQIGFTVLKSTSTRSLMHYTPEDVVFTSSSTSPNGVQGNVWLSGSGDRCGLPYIVVPHYVCCGNPGVTAGPSSLPPEMYFELEVKSLSPHSLASFNTQLDWRRAKFASHLSLPLGNAGGSTGYSSWRNNPQYLITSVFEGSGSVLVSVRHRSSAIRQVPIGVALLVCDEQPRGHADATQGTSMRNESLSRCRKLVLRDDSTLGCDNGSNKKCSSNEAGILADSGLCESCAEVEYSFPQGQGGTASCVLMLYTAEPYQEALLQVSVYTSMDVHIQPVREWSTVTTIDGSWKLGKTSGGCRALNAAMWKNNPFIALIVSRPTLVTLILLQCPSGPRKGTVVCVNKKRLALPFPTEHANHERLAIGLDLVRGDKVFTPVQSSRHVNSGEVSLTCFLCPFSSNNLPYYVVPHTMNAEENCEFKLLVYSDQNVGVLSVDKPQHEWN